MISNRNETILGRQHKKLSFLFKLMPYEKTIIVPGNNLHFNKL